MDYSVIRRDMALNRQRSHVECHEQWRETADEMPWIQFDSDWKVRIIPPFGGAYIRFCVKKNDKEISVYYDPCCRLGSFYDSNDEYIPYYEMFPDIDGDIYRVPANDINRLMERIRYVFDNWGDGNTDLSGTLDNKNDKD